METYKAPGVYVKDIARSSSTSAQASASVGMMIGFTRNGKVNEPQMVKSWTDFINKYANGLDTPFVENDYLAYAVHGFFANGGNQLYIGSVKKNAVRAEATSEKSGIRFIAASEGVWGNNIKVKITKNADWVEGEYETYDVTVSVGVVDSVTVTDLSIENIGSAFNNNKVKAWLSEIILPDPAVILDDEIEGEEEPGTPISSTFTFGEEEITLSGGTDGDDLMDADYIAAIDMASKLNDLTMIAIPGQTSNAINLALINYCDNNGLFPFLDMPMASTVDEVRQYRKGINAWTGVLAYPWGRMSDPLAQSSNGNNLKTVPTCGHLMGLYARTIENSGIHKSPAGEKATINGFVELEYMVSASELGDLNTVGVVTIMSRPNAGIVAWGARSLNSVDKDLKYVTDGLINLNIKKSLYNSTQYAVFEPNDATLWSNVKATCIGLLETLRTKGALKGTAEEAYYVIVDDSNNTEDTIAEGQLNIEAGYAPVKPAEFVIIKLAHSIV